MAAELVGTAYVRIKAITAGLASEISDGVEKGVKDADLEKGGKKLGEDLGASTSKSFKGSMADGMADGVSDAFDSPAMQKASEDGGQDVAKDVAKGVEKENKRKNPFGSMLDALRRLDFKGAFRDVDMPSLDTPDRRADAHRSGENIAESFGDGVDEGSRKRNPFSRLLTSLRKVLPDLSRDMNKGGEDAGNNFNDGLQRAHDKNGGTFKKIGESLSGMAPAPINWLAIFGPTTLAPIIGGILALGGLLIQMLGFVATAAAGAGLAVAGIAAVALPGLGALFAAFKVQTKQLERFKKRAKELLKPWEEFGIATQEHLLPGLESFLEAIGKLVPLFRDFGSNIGKVFGDVAAFAGMIFTSEKNVGALSKILDSSEVFFRNIGDAALNFADLLLPFLTTVTPLAEQFSASLASWAKGLNDTLSQEGKVESIGAKFQVWYDRFVLLAGIIGDVFVGLWGILDIAGNSATPFFDKIAGAAQAFRDWVGSTEGQNKIKKFFDDIQPVIDEVFRLIGNLFDLIVAPALGDGGATVLDRLAEALGWLNDVLEDPMTAKIAPILLDIAVALTILSFAGKGILALNSLYESIKKVKDILTGVGTALWGFAGSVAGYAQVVAGALRTLTIALFTTPVGWFLLAIAAAALAVYIAFRNWDTIVVWIKSAWEWFTKLSTPLKLVVGFFGLLFAMSPPGMFLAFVLGITAAIKNWGAIADIINDVWDAFYEFLIGIPELIPGALAAVEEFITNLPANLAKLGEDLLLFFSSLPTIIKDALITGLEALPGLIFDALGGLADLGLNLLGLIADGLIAAAPVLGEWFIKLPLMILDWVFTAAANLLELGLNILMWILDGLVQALPEIATFFIKLPWEIMTILRRAIVNLVELGASLIMALARGIFRERSRIFDFFHDLPLNILRAIAAAAEFLFNFGRGLLTGMWNGIQSMWPKVQSFFAELPGKILRFLSGMGGFLVDIGAKLMNGLWEGINEVWDSIDEFFGEIPGKIGGFFKRIPAFVTGPLTKFVSTVLGFFIGLPVKILGFLADLIPKVLGFFLDLGVQLVTALPGAFATVLGWFTGLPQMLFNLLIQGLSIILGIGSWLVENILAGIVSIAQTLWDWVTGLPQAIFDLFILGLQTYLDIGIWLLENILAGIVSIAQTLWDWFTGLPQAILDLLIAGAQLIIDIGGSIIGWIVEGLTTLGQTLWDWVTGLPGAMFDLLVGISQEVLDIGGAIIGWIVDGLNAAWHLVTTYITEFPGNMMAGFDIIWEQIKDIGGAIIGWIVEALGDAFEAGGTVIKWITDFPGNLLDGFETIKDKFLDIGGDIIGWVVEGLGDIGEKFFTLIKGAWNWAVDKLPEFSGPFGLKVSADFLKLAMGGIIPGSPLGTPVVVGEGGRSEAVVPMTRPARALAVMQESGLDKMVLDAYMGGTVSAGDSVTGDTTMLHIDTAYMSAPVDADMIVQKVVSAYNRLAS